MAIKGGTNVPMRLKIPLTLIAEVRRLKEQGRYADRYENEFVCYLVELGAQRYEKVVLPIERGDDITGRDPGLLVPQVHRTVIGG